MNNRLERTISTDFGNGPFIGLSGRLREGGNVQGSGSSLSSTPAKLTPIMSPPLLKRLTDQSFRGGLRNSLERIEERPLVRVGPQFVVKKLRKAGLPWDLLERNRDQVAKAALGHRVLIWEEPIIGIQPKLMTALHSSNQQQRAQPPGNAGGHWPFEEDPDVSSVAGTRALDCGGHTEFLTGCTERSGIGLPGLLVEVHGEEPTGLVEKEGLHAQRLLPREMTVNSFIGQRNVLARLLINSFSVPGFGRIISLPVALRFRRLAGPAIRTLPPLGVNIIASAKQRPEQGNLLRSVERRSRRWRLRLCFGRPNRKIDAVISKERAKPMVLVFDPPTLL